MSVVTGEAQLPVPTYFIGGFGGGCGAILEALPASDAKLRYLGRAGVVSPRPRARAGITPRLRAVRTPQAARPPAARRAQTKVAGLTVAFLDGSYHAAAFHAEPALPSASHQPSAAASAFSPYYTAREVAQLKQALSELEGEVDLLLTHEWPKAVALGAPSVASFATLLLWWWGRRRTSMDHTLGCPSRALARLPKGRERAVLRAGVPANLAPIDLPDAAKQGSAVVAEIAALARPRCAGPPSLAASGQWAP